MLETLTHEDFRPHVGETFTATDEDGGDHELALTGVEVHEGPDDGKRAPFSLLFSGSADGHLTQQTVQLRHAEMGEFPLFVVPLGPGDAGMRYQAVFT